MITSPKIKAMTTPKRLAQWREASRKRREARKLAGLPSESGGQATRAERMRRSRARKRDERDRERGDPQEPPR
jgi:hypothetical protein